ncbi:hypothetical protein AVEN_217262-1 [Araneus ventricosus]|uniref:Uncharacterized protein n=1 Tax=Araneus ventricosus TaxID=182803 RepID=A0A4Y2TIX9_ARAVE|nr:hypothetical protein AVEN_217262-1 [Araneus ventricosus]
MPDNGVNAGPFSKVVKPASTGFKRVFRCLVPGSARGLIQQITVNRSCLLAYDACVKVSPLSCFSVTQTISSFSVFSWREIRSL